MQRDAIEAQVAAEEDDEVAPVLPALLWARPLATQTGWTATGPWGWAGPGTQGRAEKPSVVKLGTRRMEQENLHTNHVCHH